MRGGCRGKDVSPSGHGYWPNIILFYFILEILFYVFGAGADRANGGCDLWELPGTIMEFPWARILRRGQRCQIQIWGPLSESGGALSSRLRFVIKAAHSSSVRSIPTPAPSTPSAFLLLAMELDFQIDTSWCMGCSRQILPKRSYVSIPQQLPPQPPTRAS
jgi:hypothetical protein